MIQIIKSLKHNKIIEALYRRVFPSVDYYVTKALEGCYTVLDLGCGRKSPISVVKGINKVGVDLHLPFLCEAKASKTHDEYVLANVMQLPFREKSFDAVVGLDLLEHLTKEDGHLMLKRVEELARKRIVVMTPNGFIPQEESENNPYQKHKSGWIVRDFKSEFSVFGINGLRCLRGEASTIKYRPKILWNIISDITQKIVWHYPHFAYHLLCIKEIR